MGKRGWCGSKGIIVAVVVVVVVILTTTNKTGTFR
jgi:hypothetical protein